MIFFMITSLYLGNQVFEWIKLLLRHSHQLQENGASGNFTTALYVNSLLITQAGMQT